MCHVFASPGSYKQQSLNVLLRTQSHTLIMMAQNWLQLKMSLIIIEIYMKLILQFELLLIKLPGLCQLNVLKIRKCHCFQDINNEMWAAKC